jgi:glucuronate isomerase
MTHSARESIYEAIASMRLIDPHTHINPHAPASSTLADLLGYHYYTELAHSAGMPKDQIEQEGIGPRELVGRLVANLGPIENTAQYRWLVEICRKFFGFDGDRIDQSNWEQVYDSAEQQMSLAEWPQMVLDQSNVEAVFLTNDFDDDLAGFDTDTYIPCLRTDDLVFHLTKRETRQRLAACTGIELDGSLDALRLSLRHRFDHFVSNGARACAISLPPHFQPKRISDGRAATALDHVLRGGSGSDPSDQAALSQRVFWTLAELCDEFGLPFDLMIGVNRGVYPQGVYQGQDLYDSRVSLIQYRELFNAFPQVKFPISVLASVTNQELVSYAWIFPNVITNGHWWYSNTPSFIARDAAARLEAVPQTKQIAYYSDAYKLEFVWPKFDMYRNVLAEILADHFVDGRGWSEDRAIELGRTVLRDNVDEIFPSPSGSTGLTHVDTQVETWVEDSDSETSADDEPSADEGITEPDTAPSAMAATTSSLAAGAIGMVEVGDAETGHSDFIDENSELTKFDEPGNTETVRIDEAAEDDIDFDDAEDVAMPEPTDADDDFADLPTTFDSSDTVRVEQDEVGAEDEEHAMEPDKDLAESEEISHHPLDPLPSHDEIQAVDVDDVTLHDGDSVSAAVDHEQIESEADPEPLDIGDIWGEDDGANDSKEEELLATIDLDADDEDLAVSFELIEEEEEEDETS